MRTMADATTWAKSEFILVRAKLFTRGVDTAPAGSVKTPLVLKPEGGRVEEPKSVLPLVQVPRLKSIFQVF